MCVCVRCSGGGNSLKVVLFDMGTESEIVPGVCVCEIINLSVLSMLYRAEPTGAVMFSSA